MQSNAFLSLKQVYERVARLQGVVITAEMVRPSSVAMQFKIAPGGRFYAKYPTSEMYLSPTEQVTWMAEKKEFSRTKPEPGNPLPAGFESLWPDGAVLQETKPPQRTTFAGKPAVELSCRATAGHHVLLYVDPDSLLPQGSVATAQGTTFEVHYTTVQERSLTPAELTFVAPLDARPAGGGPDLSRLIKAGNSLPGFQGTDLSGRPLSLKTLLAQNQGLVINFWFSACTGCVQEMPYLAKLDKALQTQRIRLVGINPIDPILSAKRTSSLQGLKYPTLTGKDAKSLADRVGVVAYPVTLIVDRRGVVIDALSGFDEARLVAALKKLGYRAPKKA